LTAYGCLVLAVVYFLLPETNAHRHPTRWNEVLAQSDCFGKSGIPRLRLGAVRYLCPFDSLQRGGTFPRAGGLTWISLFGRVALALGVAWFLGSLANRFLTAWFPKIPLMEIATLIALLASLLMDGSRSAIPLSLSHLVMPTAVVFMSGSITFTQCFGKSMRLFPERAGTASALMGTLFIAGSALAGFAASFLETQTGIPLALSFIALTFWQY
jgi:hypothetical protein